MSLDISKARGWKPPGRWKIVGRTQWGESWRRQERTSWSYKEAKQIARAMIRSGVWSTVEILEPT